MKSDDPILLCRDQSNGSDTPFGLGEEDACRHVYVVGQTGVGKTTLLQNLALQRIHAGQGVAFIDPHGDVAEAILDRYPRERTNDLIYFEAGAADFPIAFNPLENVPPRQRALVTAGLVSAFKSIWADSWGPRLEYILGYAIATLIEVENTSLLGIGRLLSDASYRTHIVAQVRDPFIRAFWEDEFAHYEPRYLREAIGPVQNKLGQFARSPLLRNILGQVGNKLDFRHILDHGRVFVANLSKGRLGPEPSNLLGALLVAQFKHAAMTRADIPEHERRVFHLFIDEFHNFTTDSIAEALSEARKYALSLTLAHQFIAQVSEAVRPAVFGNVGTLVCFRVCGTDARDLAAEFGQAYIAEQFCDLEKHEVFVKTLEDGRPRAPFRGQTYPPLHALNGRREKLVAHSRQRFTTPSAKVERRLRAWLARGKSGESHSGDTNAADARNQGGTQA
jgi:energy-coupling factor transporter ATP-binding protein EcfA2